MGHAKLYFIEGSNNYIGICFSSVYTKNQFKLESKSFHNTFSFTTSVCNCVITKNYFVSIRYLNILGDRNNFIEVGVKIHLHMAKNDSIFVRVVYDHAILLYR